MAKLEKAKQEVKKAPEEVKEKAKITKEKLANDFRSFRGRTGKQSDVDAGLYDPRASVAGKS